MRLSNVETSLALLGNFTNVVCLKIPLNGLIGFAKIACKLQMLRTWLFVNDCMLFIYVNLLFVSLIV